MSDTRPMSTAVRLANYLNQAGRRPEDEGYPLTPAQARRVKKKANRLASRGLR